MENLGLYIKEALKDKNEIYLSGLGVFKEERVPAFFDELKESFMPPSSMIIFNELGEERIEDEYFIQFIADKENISFEEAQLKLQESVLTIKGELEENGEYALVEFGSLKKEGNSYQFLPLQLLDEDRFPEYEPIKEFKTIEPLIKEIPEAAASPVLENNLEDIEQEVASKRWVWPTIGVALCAIIAGFWFMDPILKDYFSANKEIVPDTQAISQVIVKDPVTDVIDTNLTIAPLQDDSVMQENNFVRDIQGKYEIIIGAFSTMEEAEEYVTRTNAKGHHVYIIKNNRAGNLHKISYASFQTEEDARKALIKVREELTDKAWVFENKNFKNQ